MLVAFYTKEIVLTHSQEVVVGGHRTLVLQHFQSYFRATCIFQLKSSVKLIGVFLEFFPYF